MDESFRREAEMSINSMFPGCFRVIKYSCSCQPDETFYSVLSYSDKAASLPSGL